MAGKAIRKYVHQGRTYVEGRKGTSFSLRFTNGSSKRTLFIPTVDGVSILDGKPGSYDSRGYIVGPHSSMTIHGWRVSDKEVAQFFFSSGKEAYATKTKQGDNLGVIGCAVFEEKETDRFEEEKEQLAEWAKRNKEKNHPHCPWDNPMPDLPKRYPWIDPNITWTHAGNRAELMASNADSVRMTASSLGTGWGEYKKSNVVKVDFEKGERVATHLIYYKTRKELEDMGVVFNEALSIPKAFPGEYCQPPER